MLWKKSEVMYFSAGMMPSKETSDVRRQGDHMTNITCRKFPSEMTAHFFPWRDSAQNDTIITKEMKRVDKNERSNRNRRKRSRNERMSQRNPQTH